ncbi:MAG: Ig-like domain-containing protein [Myxococcota bacterium]
MSASNLVLAGPSGAVSASYALSDDLDTVTITPTTPLAGSAGVYTLTLTTNVRDVAGNQLDGAWSDTPRELVLRFGDMDESLPTVSSCDPESVVFTPDGDEGAGAEADTIVVAPTATAAPEWWWLEVTAADGSRVRSARTAGAAGAVEWDGRGDDGTVRPSGAYRLRIRAIDGYGNVGEACDVVVELEQHVDAP